MAEDLHARLVPLRERIDALDAQLLALLNQRAQLALQVGQAKQASDAGGPVLRPEREAQIVQALQKANAGPLPDEAISAIWRQVISACRGLETQLTVAFLGPQGSYSEQASLEHFGHAVSRLRCPSFDAVFRAVETGQADVGLVPVENTNEGAVSRTLDLLLRSPLKVQGERSIDIHHNLLTRTGGLQGVRKVLGHPQALAQCQEWLTRHHPELERMAVTSTAEAARMAAEDASCAAVAGDAAAAAWGLSAVASGIQDDAHNQTRFLVLGQHAPGATGRDKTSLILSVSNRAGAVYEMLAPFARHGVSMTRLESRPARTGQWEYYFYVDVLGHAQDAPVAQALDELRAEVAFFKLLGSYPRQ